MSKPLGFNNTYAFGMTEAKADALHITTLSDLKKHADLKLGVERRSRSGPTAGRG